jgi:hypothetical protein
VDYYPQPVSLTSDRRGALLAYKALFEKHEGRIAALEDNTRAQHYFYRGRIYLTHRQFGRGLRSIVRALSIDPTTLRDVMHYLFVESARKVASRMRHASRSGRVSSEA